MKLRQVLLIAVFFAARSGFAASDSGDWVMLFNGTNLAGARVTINGVIQPILSDTANSITFRVAVGTTTGPIVVTTPNGVVASRTSFNVIQ